MYIDVAKYPENYDWLPREVQENMIQYLNDMFKRVVENRGTPMEDKYRTLLCGALNALATLGIHVEYGWCGHRDTYVLATRGMAELQEDYLMDMMDEG